MLAANSNWVAEADRLGLLVERDGFPAALAFARTTRRSYRRAVLHGLTPRSPGLPREMRRTYIESYLAFTAFLCQAKEAGHEVDL